MGRLSHSLISVAAKTLQTATGVGASLALRVSHERTRSVRQRREGGYLLALSEAGLKKGSHTMGRLANWLRQHA